MNARVNAFGFAFAFLALHGVAQLALPTGPTTAGATSEQAPPAPGRAKISFAESMHDFGKVKSGVVVTHEFMFTNVGDAPLEITGVRTSCGCTTAGEWSQRVEPGMTGRIPVQFNTGGFAGMVMKTVTVDSNDPERPSVVLQLRANVWKPVDVNPQYAVIYANAETVAESMAAVRITSNDDQPLELSPPECNNAYFTAALKTIQPGKEFEVEIRPVPEPNPMNRQGVVTLRTTSTNAPLIEIRAMTILQPVVIVTPPQIHLPPGPLPSQIAITLTVRNAGTNAMALSDARATVPGVNVEIKEMEPGRAFNVIAQFPAGFVVQPGQPAEVTFRSSHPLYPEFRVPVVQPYQPGAPPGPRAALVKPGPHS
ncbi:MAG: DUF1573 domain-containing protein [Verrucomicrobiales bacterium]|nr:DUF1573 domain-containing protein [Verrucomicrobiales bacterium]